MLQEELTFKRLSEGTGITYEQIPRLWSAFLQQIEQRLSNTACLDMGGLGYWSLKLNDEFIAEVEGKGSFIVPPRLTLSLSPSKPLESKETYTLLDFTEGLTLATELSERTVTNFLSNFTELLDKVSKEKNEVLCPKLGRLSRILNEAGEDIGYKLVLAENFAEGLNKPFAMFSPIAVEGLDTAQSKLEVIHYPDQEAMALPLECYYYKQENVIPNKNNETMSVEDNDKNQDLGLANDEEYIVPVTENEDLSLSEEELQVKEPKGEETLDLGALPEEEEQRQKEKKKGAWFFYLVLLVFLLALTYGLLRLYQKNKGRLEPNKVISEKVQEQAPVKLEKAKPAKADSIKSDSLNTPKKEVEEYKEIKIHSGHTLRKIALKEYGHKVFWAYIYEENKDIIKNPNNVPIGTKLRLPAKSKYGINAKDNNSIKKALELEQKIYTELK